jgi:hypothetical protein
MSPSHSLGVTNTVGRLAADGVVVDVFIGKAAIALPPLAYRPLNSAAREAARRSRRMESARSAAEGPSKRAGSGPERATA